MSEQVKQGKLVWPSPEVQLRLDGKDVLVKVQNLPSGLPDTFVCYTKEEHIVHFRMTRAFQPRLIKLNRSSAGEGICWGQLMDKGYGKKYGDASLEDGDKLRLREMHNDQVEHHTVGYFLTFCVGGSDAKGVGEWKSACPGKYLEGGRAAGGNLVYQRDDVGGRAWRVLLRRWQVDRPHGAKGHLDVDLWRVGVSFHSTNSRLCLRLLSQLVG